MRPWQYEPINRTTQENYYWKKYGITMEEYDLLADNQNYKCVGCGIIPKRRLMVDHYHTTGNIRGLLCCRCNSFISDAFDNPTMLKWALNYSKCRRKDK